MASIGSIGVTGSGTLAAPVPPQPAATGDQEVRTFCHSLHETAYVFITQKDEECINEVAAHWRLGSALNFFDLMAMDIWNDMGTLPLCSKPFREEFIRIYKLLSTAAEKEYIRNHQFSLPKDLFGPLTEDMEKLVNLTNIMMQAFPKRSLSREDLKSISGIHRKLGILVDYFEESREIREALTCQSISSYHPSHLEYNRDHAAIFVEFLKALYPEEQLDLSAREVKDSPPGTVYKKIFETNEANYQQALKEALRVRGKIEKGEQFDINRLSELSCFGKMIRGLKTDLEIGCFKRDPYAIQNRALANINLFLNRKDQNMGSLHGLFQEAMSKIYTKLGEDFNGRMQEISSIKRLMGKARQLTCFYGIPAIMRLIKSEIKTIHRLAKGDEENYAKCFEALLSLFTILHDIETLRNANHQQLDAQRIPADLLDYVELDFDRSVSSDSVESGSSSPEPVEELKEAPVAGSLFKKSTVSDRSSQVRAHQVYIPSVGEKCSKVARLILRSDFYLAKDTHHEYYRHVRYPHVQIKIPSHGTLSKGAHHELVGAMKEVQRLDGAWR